MIGLIAGPVFLAADKFLLKLEIDDPVNAIPVNGVGGFILKVSFLCFLTYALGILGVLCVPLLRGDGKGKYLKS